MSVVMYVKGPPVLKASHIRRRDDSSIYRYYFELVPLIDYQMP